MPRTSARKRALGKLRKQIHALREYQFMNLLFGGDVLDLDDLLLEEELREQYKKLSEQRYHRRYTTYRTGDAWVAFEEDLDDSSPTCWVNAEEFKCKYGMTRESFWKLHELIKGHAVFRQAKYRKQMPSQYQLLVLLAFLRVEGDGMCGKKARHSIRLSVGTIDNCKERVTVAIVESLFKKTVYWPDETERLEISRRFQAKWKLPNVVGVADGTLFPLAFRPTREDASDFHG